VAVDGDGFLVLYVLQVFGQDVYGFGTVPAEGQLFVHNIDRVPVPGPDGIEIDLAQIVEQGGDAKGAFNKVYSAAWFSYSHYVWSNLLAKQKTPVYLYYFTKDNGSLGNAHGGEMPYAYGNLWRHGWLYTDADYQLSDTMQRYWVNFVKTGNPNGDGVPRWEAVTDPAYIFELGGHLGQTEERFIKLYEILDRMQGWENME
jgi:para-nitrobenzyl esterase